MNSKTYLIAIVLLLFGIFAIVALQYSGEEDNSLANSVENVSNTLNEGMEEVEDEIDDNTTDY